MRYAHQAAICGARLLMPDIKSNVSDRMLCVSCQEMPTRMEVAMDERKSGEEGLRLVQRLEPLHLAFSAGVSVDASSRHDC